MAKSKRKLGNFIDQITDVEVTVITTPRVFVKWKNTEEGRDKTDCFERVVFFKNDDIERVYYVNTNNRQYAYYSGEFFDMLEYLYNKYNKKK